jgi:hypothetical protein
MVLGSHPVFCVEHEQKMHTYLFYYLAKRKILGPETW